MKISRPDKSEYPEYFETYIKLVKDDNVFRFMESQILGMQAFLSEIPEDKEAFTYSEGKWTLKEVFGHVIDTERIMSYRALRFARNDKTPLAGFDEKEYVKHSNFNDRSIYELAHEFGLVREANLAMFKSFDEAALSRKGIANDNELSVKALIYVIAGHTMHHMNVIRSKYLVLLD
jgi:hypothetical protein